MLSFRLGQGSKSHHFSGFLSGGAVHIEPFYEYFRSGRSRSAILGIEIGFKSNGSVDGVFGAADGRCFCIRIAYAV